MARITGISSERVHGWFRLLTETLGRRKHFAVSFLNASHETTRNKMEEVVILDDPLPSANIAREAGYRPDCPQISSVQLTDNQVIGGSKHLPLGQTPYTITIHVVRGNQGFGFSVAWTKPPRVERVEEGLPADQAGLKPGDYIIFVSQYNVVKYEEDAVLDIIRECGDTLPLEVYRRGVSKHPRGLANGYTNRPPPNENEAHPRKRLSHITFNTENVSADRQHIIYAVINCEQAFSHSCRFGLERYLIPLKFRSDLITHRQHETLFNNLDQLMDLSETLVDRLMGNENDNIGDQVGRAYYMLIEELAEHYSTYMEGLPEADKVLAHKLHDMDFKDFLQVPLVPRKKPDITTFIHKPAEHLREVLDLLTQVYSVSPGHHDNTYLDTVLDRLKACYRGVTSQQNIMEPAPPVPPPSGLPGTTPTHSILRSPAPLRPPLVSVSDIEQRLVFTKFTQPFRLNDGRRQWVFGGELYKFEGRHLKQHWAMLFTDLLLFTKINRDRVIFVMEDPIPLTGVCQALFTVKKKPTEFRLIVDSRVRVSGAGSGYLTTPKNQRPTNKNSCSGRAHKKTLVLRAPTVDLKATWNNLIQRQLYLSQQQQQQQLGSPHILHHTDLGSTSLSRAASTDGLHAFPPATGRFSSSVGDLRRGGGQDEEEIELDLGNDRPKGLSSKLFKSSKVKGKPGGDREEELVLNLNDEASHPPAVASTSTPAPAPSTSRVSQNQRRSVPPQGELEFVIEDEEPRGSSSRRVRTSRPSRVRYGGGREEELVFSLDDDELLTSSQYARPGRVTSALHSYNHQPIPDIVIDQNVEHTAVDNTGYHYSDEEVLNDIIIEDVKTGVQSSIDPKKGKGIGGKVKDKLFPNRHLPKKKKMNSVKKVEKFVDSIMVEDLDGQGGRVTPVFVGEDDITPDEFAQKRKDLLRNRPRNYVEGDEEVVIFDMSSPSTSQLSPMQAELSMIEERRKFALKRKEEKRTAMRLEGIEEESPDRSVSQNHEQQHHHKTVLSPEEYEDYIGDAVEKDYPELAGVTETVSTQQQEEEEEEMQRRLYEQQEQQQQQLQEEQEQQELQQQQQQQQEYEVQQQQPTGPLSGSASMNFMDDHSPTTNGNGDYFHRCVAKYPREPPRQACGSFSVEANNLLTSEVDSRYDTCRNAPETNLLNNNESINSFATHFRTSCVASNNYASGDRKPQRTTSVSSSTSASATESRNNSTSASEHSSMSISTGSVSSNLSNVNKNRSNLFLPTSTSLPEISIEPPTPQAPKPKDGFDRENKVKYDLRVPGYRSMFLTVPGFDDDDSDRYLPKYSFDSDDEEQSSSEDDDVVHKPRVFASLAGMAEGRGLKRYGSSCDIAKFGIDTTDEPIYSHEDDLNANFDANALKSKVGGTGSGPFVAGKLAMFEKVVEEEHQKFIECQEVRKRIFRAPKKSGDYIEKFYSPQVIETIDARATARSRSLRYYDDEYDSYNNRRTPTPTDMMTPYGGQPSPPAPTKYSCSSNVYPAPKYDTPRTPTPTQVYDTTPYNNDDFDTYDYVGDRSQSTRPSTYDYVEDRSQSATPVNDRTDTRQCTPLPQATADNDENYLKSTEYNSYGQSPAASPGPSRSAQPSSSKKMLDQRTDEVLEMLDNSYLDMVVPSEAGPSYEHDEDDVDGAIAGYSGYETPELPTRSMASLPEPDPLDDVFEIEDYDSMGSTTSLGGRHKRKAAAPPPPPSGSTTDNNNTATTSSDTKRGGAAGFFSRARRDRDKDKDKDKEKKDKKKDKDKEKEKREFFKKKDKDKEKDTDKAAGKRFQLFGGVKKASEPNTADEASAKSPKKDKGKRRFFGRGKENFIGRTPHISHGSDPQVARMAGESFEQESIDLEGETDEVL